MQKVRLIAMTKAGKKHPLVLLAADWNNTAITGQHIDPKDSTTSDNLTREQMTGKVPLRADQQEKFPFIINPDEYYNFENLRYFDKDDDKDAAMLKFILLQRNVAPSKAAFNRQVHTHYVEDLETEALATVNDMDAMANAMEKIRNSNIDVRMETAMYLSYAIPGKSIDVKSMSHTRITAELYKLCQTVPEKVLEAYSKNKVQDIYILNLVRYDIITRKNTGFFDGVNYIGSTIESVKQFIEKEANSAAVDRWGKELLIRKGKVQREVSPEAEAVEFINKAKVLFADEKYKESLKLLMRAESKHRENPEIEIFKGKILKALEDKVAEFDPQKFTDAQKTFYAEIKDQDFENLVNICSSRKLGKVESLKKLDREALIIKLVKTAK